MYDSSLNCTNQMFRINARVVPDKRLVRKSIQNKKKKTIIIVIKKIIKWKKEKAKDVRIARNCNFDLKNLKNAKLGYLWLHSSQDGEHIECKLITEICINYTISASAICHIKKNNYLQKLSLKKNMKFRNWNSMMYAQKRTLRRR